MEETPTELVVENGDSSPSPAASPLAPEENGNGHVENGDAEERVEEQLVRWGRTLSPISSQRSVSSHMRGLRLGNRSAATGKLQPSSQHCFRNSGGS
jgi:hypothetical protein